MQEYFTALFLVCVLAGIVGVLSPSDSAKKYIEYLCALCVMGAMVIPIIREFPSENDFFNIFSGYESEEQDYEEIYNNFWNAEDERMAAQTLRSGLSEQLEMSQEWFSLELCVSRDEQGRVLEGVRLYITDAKALAANPEIIRSYFLGTVGVDCEIVYNLSAE